MFTIHAQSQPYPFKQFPLPTDIPPVSQLYEDHLGFIWLATVEGLYRFDGVHYTFYSGKDKQNGLGREAITCIYEDNRNHLWIGARTGLYRYDPASHDFDKFSYSDENYAGYIHQESDTSFIVHTYHGIYWFYPNTNRWALLDVGLKSNLLYAVIRGRQDDLWIGTDHIIRRYDLIEKTYRDFTMTFPAYALAKEKISATNMFMDSRDQLWINTWYKGVMRLDTRTGKATILDTVRSNREDFLLDMYNSSMTEDQDGNVWLASERSGINIYHPKTGTISHILKGTDYTHGLIGNYFNIMTDRAYNIWIKSDRALHYLSSKSYLPKLISDPHLYIPDALFIHFLQSDFALIGTFFGLFGITPSTGQVVSFNQALGLPSQPNAELQSIPDLLVSHNDTLWFPSPQGLRSMAYMVDKRGLPEFKYDRLYPTPSTFWPSRIFAINDSTFFIKGRSNTQVFATFNAHSGIYTYHELPDSLMLNQAIAYHGDTVLLAIRNKGIYHYDLSEQTRHRIPWCFDDPGVQIHKPIFYNIVQFDDGTYGLCTADHGLIIYHPKTNLFHQIDVTPYTNKNVVFSADKDTGGNMWIQTNSDLLFYESKTERLSKLNLANSFKGNNPTYFMSAGKEMYTTFEGGCYRIEPEQLFIKSERPQLFLESIKAGNRALALTTNSIRLAYDDNFLTYDFIGLDYDNPQGMNYWYKIPELSNEWISLGHHTSISLGQLTPGTYNFSIKASNDADLWSDEIHAPEIRITPPFWKSWWFILLLTAVAISLTAYLLWLRRTKIDSELKLRNKIAKDLHDDIGSTLSGIRIFSGIAADMAGGNKELAPLLQTISDKSDMMMQSMSDIVWSINPVYDSLHDMMIRLKQYMNEVLETQNIAVHFNAHVDLKNTKLELSHRKEIFLALKEVIHNVAKHAACRTLLFDIARQRGDLVFTIRDDGIGMDESTIVSGNGLRNIRERIEQIGGSVKRQSVPGQGTGYEIRIAVT